jgi:hypothetical protein
VRALVVTLLLLSGCARCKSAPPAPHLKRSMDLRTALILSFPEYRGAKVLDGHATLTRTVSGVESLAPLLKDLHVPPPLELRLVREGTPGELSVTLPMTDELVGSVYSSPRAISTGEMALYFPRAKGLVTERESFELTLHYRGSTLHRAAFLSRQVIELLLGNQQWALRDGGAEGFEPNNPEDGGYGDVPQQFTATLDEPGFGGQLEVHRDVKDITVSYRLVTDEPDAGR